jgi:hypothetical protein
VRLQRCFIFIDFVVVEAVSVLAVLNNVESQASTLGLLGMLRIMPHRYQVFGDMLRLHLNSDVQYDPRSPPLFELIVTNDHADTVPSDPGQSAIGNRSASGSSHDGTTAF